ncbi:MAG TPA: hypothetical protein VGV69_01575, partial [Solirubrobacterales bacterium]|nr:hypothetical protein [Solirubrobacterales bacterium]
MTDWTQEYPVEGPPEATGVLVGLQCSDMPVGGTMWFAVAGGETPGGEAWQPLESGKITIVNPNESVFLHTNWPAGVQTTMKVGYSGPEPSPGGSIEPTIGIEAPGSSLDSAEEVTAQTWPQEFPVAGPTEAGNVAIGLRCSQVPAGST